MFRRLIKPTIRLSQLISVRNVSGINSEAEVGMIQKKEKEIRICVDCVYFNRKNGEYVCSRFSEKDVIYGGDTYISAKECRKDETKCGQEAILYKQVTALESFKNFQSQLIFGIILPVTITTSGTLMLCCLLFP